MTGDDDDDFLQKRHEVLYRAELSSIYHRKRERFLALCERGGKASALIAGTAAFSSILQSPEMKSYAGLAVAVVTLPALVFSWADRARQHSELAQKYVAIQSEIVGTPIAKLTEEILCSWESRLRIIEAAEPPTLTALVRLCQNQMALAADQKDKFIPMSRKERWLCQIFDFPDWYEEPEPEKPKAKKPWLWWIL